MQRPYLMPEYDPDDGLVHGFIEFGGRAVNLNRLSEQEGLSYSYLWRVFNGLRIPSIPYAIKISAYLGMSMPEFITALDRIRQAGAVQD